MPAIQQHIELLRAQGSEVLVATPPLCQELWERAQKDGRFHLGQLFVVNQPLDKGLGGALEFPTGDVWLLYARDQPEEAARTLLHELCHTCHWTEAPPTLEAYWDEEEAVIWEAYHLAQEWGVPDLFPLQLVFQELRTAAHGRIADTLAAQVAGTTWEPCARATYWVLAHISHQHGWDGFEFELALRGTSPNESHNAAILDFDRSCSRERWHPAKTGGSFGSEALPQGTKSARLLRRTLRWLARRDGPGHWRDPEAGSRRIFFVMRRLHDSCGLAALLRASQTMLLAHPEVSARATWTLFCDPDPQADRLYSLTLSYGEDIPSAHLWVWASRRGGVAGVAEAAWQRYSMGWLAQANLVLGGRLEVGARLLQGDRKWWQRSSNQRTRPGRSDTMAEQVMEGSQPS